MGVAREERCAGMLVTLVHGGHPWCCGLRLHLAMVLNSSVYLTNTSVYVVIVLKEQNGHLSRLLQ